MFELKHLFTFLVLTVPIASHANCTKVTSTSSLSSELIAAGYTAGSWTGACNSCGGSSNINNVVSISSSSSIMPSGTLLATSTATTLESGRSAGYEANQILYRCALADADSLYEMYSLRGQGYNYLGYQITDEIEDGYYSYVKNVAFRLTNTLTGEYYSRYWKSRKLTSDSWVQDSNYIYIPASAFSDVVWELFKIDTASSYSPNSAARYVYNVGVTIGRTAFKGPGLNTANLNAGDDSRTIYLGYYENWPSAWDLSGVVFVRGSTCLIKDYPSVVLFPTISTVSLNNGESSTSAFDISLSCEDSAVSSVSTSTTSSANVAMGFLVNQSTAVTAATNLGLVTSNGGLTHLLDTNYGSSGVASGAGIKIYDESGTALNLLTSTTPATGNTGGWYAYKDLTTSQGDSTDGITTYTGNFTASLEAISGETVTAGSVNAQLQVVVSFQ